MKFNAFGFFNDNGKVSILHTQLDDTNANSKRAEVLKVSGVILW